GLTLSVYPPIGNAARSDLDVLLGIRRVYGFARHADHIVLLLVHELACRVHGGLEQLEDLVAVINLYPDVNHGDVLNNLGLWIDSDHLAIDRAIWIGLNGNVYRLADSHVCDVGLIHR